MIGTVRLRALLPGGLIESRGRENVAAFLPSLLAEFDTVDVLDSAGEHVADRLLVHYRLGLRRGGSRWVCTQTAVCTIVDECLAVINLLCSGFREAGYDDHVGPAVVRASAAAHRR